MKQETKPSDPLIRIILTAQHQADTSGEEMHIWKVTPDKHDASKMIYVMTPADLPPDFGPLGSRSYVDCVYPSKKA